MASVYHFLPNPAAVSIALSERYLEQLEACLCAPVETAAALDWSGIIALLNRRAVTFYRRHPYAQSLILGSDHSFAIRRADLANNRRIAAFIALLLQDHLPGAAPAEVFETVVTGITAADAVFALAIIEQGEITDRAAQQAWFAACGYVAARHRLSLPDPDIYSIFIE
jgi:hypothetical protein